MTSDDLAKRLDNIAASSSACTAPWAIDGTIGCAASPIRITFPSDHFLNGLAEYIGHLCMDFALLRIVISSLCQPLKSSKAES